MSDSNNQEVPVAATELKDTANLLYKKKSFSEANAIYESIIKIFKSNASAQFIRTVRCNRAACLIELGQYQSAIEELDVVLQVSTTPTTVRVEPIVLKAHFRKARCLSELGRDEEALKELNAYRDLSNGKMDDVEPQLRSKILQQLKNSATSEFNPPHGLTIPFVFLLNRQGAVSIGQTLDIINERLPPMDLTSYNFIVHHSKQAEAVPLLAQVMKSLHDHSDWAALHAFFDKRHPTGTFSGAPKLKSQYGNREYSVPVNIDTTSVGLPADFFKKFDDGISAALYAMPGDPLPASIGPVLGISIGMHIMDLCYCGEDPKGRRFRDWESLWKAIALWAREYETARATNGDIAYSTRGRPESEKDTWGVKPEYIWTRPVEGAEAFAYAFSQMVVSPFKFRNWELDYLALLVSQEFCRIFEDRFPVNGPLDVYSGPKAKACPGTTKGDDWVEWSKTLRPGQILVPKTQFEARWAVIVVGGLTFKLVLKLKVEPWYLCSKPDHIYL